MKKFLSLLLCFCMALGLVLSSYAVDLDEPSIQTVTYQEQDLGDGIILTEELIVQESARSTVKEATKKQTYTRAGVTIAIISVTGTFRYDGSTVSVTSKSVSRKDTYDGWSYSQSSLSSSGGTITLSAKITKLVVLSVPVNLTLTCSKNGTIT